MDILLIVIGTLFILAGLVGSLLPVLPGPPLSYVGLLLLQFTSAAPFGAWFFVIWLLIVIAVMLVDNLVPVYGTKKYGGTPYGIWGSIVGLVAGAFFFPPVGMIVGPLLGAYLGELAGGKSSDQAYTAAMGSFLGFLAGTLIKLIASGIMAYYFFVNI